MADKVNQEIINQLAASIANDTGNMHQDELDQISSSFDKTLNDALKAFNSSTFDDDGFIKRMRGIELDGGKDKDMVRNVLNGAISSYAGADAINQSELLLRRDLENICTQMPEMHDVIYIVRDAIIECNVATGEVSRDLVFENRTISVESLETQAKELETRHNLLMAIKNFIVPNTLKSGEMYIQVVPYAKLFAEIEALKDSHSISHKRNYNTTAFRESCPVSLIESCKSHTPKSLYDDNNLKSFMESASSVVKTASSEVAEIAGASSGKGTSKDTVVKEVASSILRSIEVCNGTSPLLAEYGPDCFSEMVFNEYRESEKKRAANNGEDPASHFMEAMNFNQVSDDLFGGIDQDDVSIKGYKDIKGCYIKYLDALRVTPIRIDRRVIGYLYVTTTMDLQNNPANPNGIVDLSYQQYTRDRNMVDNLANMIIRSFDRKMLERNIKLKNEIAEIIMAHKFAEGKLSFIYIPENEVIRIVINEDENGKGHSILEPSMFSARNYLLLTMYNMLYTLNNNTTRVHYVKSSGLNKDYAAQVQRTMRKFQSRRITIDDVYSYTNVLNKIGGIGEMVLPAGRNDYKALETDVIEAVQNPINIEFLEQQRRQAIAGTGVPSLLIINAIDEVDFAKTLEIANTRFLSTVSAYKIDFNNGITKFYQRLMKYSTDMEDEVIQAFKFKFHTIRQPEMNITADMISNFNNIVEAVMSAYYSKSEMEDDKGNPTAKQKHLRRRLAMKYLPQLDFDELDEIIAAVETDYPDDELQQRVSDLNIDEEDLDKIGAKKKKRKKVKDEEDEETSS